MVGDIENRSLLRIPAATPRQWRRSSVKRMACEEPQEGARERSHWKIIYILKNYLSRSELFKVAFQQSVVLGSFQSLALLGCKKGSVATQEDILRGRSQ